ncbi:MAG TPA: hypothetical protein VFM63_09765, partial [Pyrinomonadaceae bacterium]|nr:hypothetical protein [Pyrinomonadaceae bacterium]
MKIAQAIKGIASLVGVVLLGIRLDVWINHKSDVNTLFHVKGLLEALAMMLTFDDTPFFLNKVGRQTALYFVLVETQLKAVICGVHIAGIIVEVRAALPGTEQPA